MATVTEVVYTDDYTKKPLRPEAVHPTRLVVDGREYELHLSASSREALDQALVPFIGDALGTTVPRKPHHVATPSRRGPAKMDREQIRAKRAWWHANWKRAKLPRPSTHGRIPQQVDEAYERHGGSPVPAGR